MLTLRVVHAHFGDSLVLIYGTKAKPRYSLIDGGPAKTFVPHLENVLDDLKPNKLDTVCLSHVDTDHTTGLQELFSELRDQETDGEQPLVSVGDFWINQFSTTIDGDAGKREIQLADIVQATAPAGTMDLASAAINGIKHGHGLVVLAKQLAVPINQQTNGQRWLAGAIDPFDFHGLEITVVGPTEKNLKKLRTEWDDFIAEQQERIQNGEIAAAIKADTSMPNLSSIQLLVKSGSKRLLLTGDGRGDHLLSALEDADLLDDNGDIDVDVFKLPHHGSARNMSAEVFERVRAKTYVASANGRDDNPDTATLGWMLAAAKKQKRTFELVLTNLPDHTAEWVEKNPPDKNNYKLSVRDAGDNFIDVVVD